MERSGVYFVQRRSRRKRGGGGKRGAGILIAVLLLLTCAICAMAVFLPELSQTSRSPEFDGKTFYCLVTAESDDFGAAYEAAEGTAAQNGAGYIYNDGKFRVIAAVYATEAEASAVVSVNAGSSYIAVAVPHCALEAEDADVLEYITGDWFREVAGAANDLDRGVITSAAADHRASAACKRLLNMSDGLHSAPLRRAVIKAGEYELHNDRSVVSYLRYIAVRAILKVCDALS